MKNSNFGMLVGGALFIGMLAVISTASVSYASRTENEYGGVIIGAFGRAKLRNTIEISTDEAKNLMMEYRSQEINVYPSNNDKIVIKEYLVSDREESKGKVTVENGTARVTAGERMIYIFSFFSGERIDVYLPEHLLKEITLTTASGNITQKEAFDLGCTSLSVAANSGNIGWKEADAENIHFKAASGNITLDNISGAGTVKATSGNIRMKNFWGSGKIEAISGNIDVEAGEITGDFSIRANSGNVTMEAQQVKGNIEANATSGNIRLDLPEGMEFQFEAHTTSGNIHTSFDESLSFHKKGNEAKGQVGESDKYRVFASATSGNIKVTR